MTGKVNAIISGQSGVALLMHAGELASLHAGRGPEVVRRRPSEARFLLGDATDLQVLENVALPEVSRRLELATAQMDALHVALILLDGSLSADTRQEAASELQELMEDEAVAVYVESLLYAHPLPGDSDLAGAFAACTPETEQTRHFLQKLESLQALIAEVHFAWEMIPADAFGPEDRALVRAHAAREGLFRDLVLLRAAGTSVQPFLVNALLQSKIKNKRDILRAWVAPLQEPRPVSRPYDLRSERKDQFVAEAPSEDQAWIGGREAFQRVERQKAAILEEMKRRRFDRVERYVAELIDFQLRSGGPVYVCKSLCDLAMKAKGLGLARLQLELTRRSKEIKPDDGWSWTQYGGALLNNGQLNDALVAYDRAVAYAPSAEPRNGRAEVLKAQNRLSEALFAYEGVIADFPENVVARNGRAEVLKAQNRLSEALSAYEEVIAHFPGDVVARNGRAEVLKAQNRLSEALSAYEGVIAHFPGDVVARTGRAEVLKAQNRLSEALSAYEGVIADFPENVVARNGRAEVLKAQNRLSEALSAYEGVVADFPENVVARTGRAEVLKAQNRLSEALSAYEGVIADFPGNAVARNGRAEVLKAQNRLSEALSAYEGVIADFPENVVARTSRAEVLKAQNRLSEALSAYEGVIADFPGDVVARNGRAEVLKAQNRLSEALSAYEGVIADFPGNAVARNGRAEVLKVQSRLSEALSAYEGVIADFPGNAVARTGRAEVLKAQNRLSEALSAYEEVIADFPGDVVARNGRAEVLKAQSRLSEALSAYEGVIADFPGNAVARNGRAEVLRAQNRLGEALSAYEGVIADFPESVVAHNGRSVVLSLMERWEDALLDLPSASPVTEQEWTGYHIRGMIYLRTGRTEEALQIFRNGIESCPRPAQREYFRTALAVAQIQRQDFETVEEVLEEVTEPALEAPANLLRFHARGARGQLEQAAEARRRLRSVEGRPEYREVLSEIDRRFIERTGARWSDERLIQSEIKLLLAA